MAFKRYPRLIAVDPGKSGGIAARLSDGKEIRTWSMPETEGDLVHLLGSLCTHTSDDYLPVLYLEQVGGFTGGPAPGSAMFNFGWWASGPLWIAMSYQIKVHKIPPQKWIKHHGLGVKAGKGDRANREWKNKLKSAAQRLHPGMTVTLKTADALLLLDYGIAKEK